MAQFIRELKAFLLQAADERLSETYTHQTYHEIIERLTSLEAKLEECHGPAEWQHRRLDGQT